MRAKDIKAITVVGNFGQELHELEIFTEKKLSLGKKDVTLKGAYLDASGKVPLTEIEDIKSTKRGAKYRTRLCFKPFPYRYDFELDLKVDGETVHVAKGDVKEVSVKDLDKFEAAEKNGVVYRLYRPDVKSKRPLILFLHGGGECGSDNISQMTGTLGAIKLAERYSDMYVMAPQAPDGNGISMDENLKKMLSRGNPFRNNMSDTPFSLKGEYGWNRDYLSKVSGIIRDLIDEGLVDEKRVYVIGLSMGGGGCITMCSVDPELFAGAVAICPSMNGETYSILRSFPKLPLWIAAAYVDHQKSRNSYILDACSKNWKDGRDDIQFSMLSEEELAKFGIGTNPDLTVRELLAENHNVWIPVLCNERGILDWMVSNVKSREK